MHETILVWHSRIIFIKFKGFKFALDRTIFKFFISSQVEELVDLFS